MLRPAFLFRATAPPRRFLAPAISSPRLLTTTSSGSQPTDAPAPPAPTQTSADLSATTTPTAKTNRRLPYLVSRTPSKNLPIYQDCKRGGNFKVTHLKKVAGNAQLLKLGLAAELSLKPDQIRVNPVTGHIEIRVSRPHSRSSPTSTRR
jgi:large subunit ribosomal protein L49